MFTACKRKLCERRRNKLCGLLITAVVVAGFFFFGYFCDDRLCGRLSTSAGGQHRSSQHHAPASYHLADGSTDPQTTFDDAALSRDYPFDPEGNDVIVFLHMQKTGGSTFGRHLVKNLDAKPPCRCHRGRKRCDCFNKHKHWWLFSRYSLGWPCGLHADWTELKTCVDEAMNKKEQVVRPRRYLYITMVREPLLRYLSEWKHVRRGSTWLASRLRCNGRQATLQEVPFCFIEDWRGVSLKEFLSCPHNLANNRQTRMLANLSLVGCYNYSAMLPAQRDAIMLQSAKTNLREMAFFGLVEYQRASQYLFEKTFHMRFIDNFEQFSVTHANRANVSDSQRVQVLGTNRLDVELYQYAKELFMKRLHKMRASDGTLGHYDVDGDTIKVPRTEYEEDESYDDDNDVDAVRH